MDFVRHVRLALTGRRGVFAVALLALISRRLGSRFSCPLGRVMMTFITLAAAPIAAATTAATPTLLIVVAVAIGVRTAFGTFAGVLLHRHAFRHRLVIIPLGGEREGRDTPF